MKNQVEKELKSFILEDFNVNFDKTDSLYLSGLMPRDMVLKPEHLRQVQNLQIHHGIR